MDSQGVMANIHSYGSAIQSSGYREGAKGQSTQQKLKIPNLTSNFKNFSTLTSFTDSREKATTGAAAQLQVRPGSKTAAGASAFYYAKALLMRSRRDSNCSFAA